MSTLTSPPVTEPSPIKQRALAAHNGTGQGPVKRDLSHRTTAAVDWLGGGWLQERSRYEQLKLEARKIYSRAFGIVSEEEWDAAFNMSYWKFCQAQNSDRARIEHPASWIATAAKNEIISEYRKVSRQLPTPDHDLRELPGSAEEAFSSIERRHVLRDVCFVLNLLPARQRRVWAARFVWDFTPEEIQEQLGISRKAYEKALQQATSFLLDKLQAARQDVCATAEMRSLITGYAIWGEGHYSPARAALARAHLDSCPACRQTIRMLRAAKPGCDAPATRSEARPGGVNQSRGVGRGHGRAHLGARTSRGTRQRQRVLAG